MCCLGPRRRSRPPKPPFRPARPANHGGLPSTSLSGSAMASSATDISSVSTSSIASVKEVLGDGPLTYGFDEICLATGNFDPAKQVGRSVWKASLRDSLVAISRKLGYASPFSTRLRRVHALHHLNLVRLLGACRNGEFLYLVYEFIESSNLRDCLRSKHGVSYSVLSSWHSRLQIAVDIAKGIEYLHHLTSPTLIHKYIDSRNILVGNNLRAKVAHVGVAFLTGEIDLFEEKVLELDNSEIQPHNSREIQPHNSSDRKLTRSRSIKINGIQGYMPPEYLTSGLVSTKYDVFAFGVVLAEILSGREAVVSQHRKNVSLLEVLRSVMEGDDSKRKLRKWMDPLLKDSYPLDDANRVATIALSCVDLDPLKRPQISDVGLRLHRLLSSAEKWEATHKAQQEMLTSTFEAR